MNVTARPGGFSPQVVNNERKTMTDTNPLRFNLVDEPFIPCTTTDGRHVELGLRETLTQAHELRELRDNSPLVTLSLHRFLIAIMHAASGDPQSLPDWESLWKSERLDETLIDGYLNQWHDRFDLFEPDRAFYQAWGWELEEDKRKGPNELAQELTRGNNATLFDHTTDIPSPAISFAEAARNLIANQAFAAPGGVSATGNRTGAPLVGKVVTLPTGRTLRETLLLNMIPAELRPEVLQPKGTPVWEREDASFTESAGPQGYLDLLTWQPRRVRLHTTGDLVTTISYAQGRKLLMPDGCFDPAAAYRSERPVEFDADRAVWRDSEALFSQTGENLQRPVVLNFLAVLTDWGYLPADRELGLVCAGLKNRQAKVFFWRHESLPLPLRYLSDSDVTARLVRALTAAEQIGERLGLAVKDAVTALLSPQDSRPDPNRRRQLVDSLGAERLYWSRLETPFRRFFVQLAEIPEDQPDRRQQCLAEWVMNDCRQNAWRAYNESVGRLNQSARTLRAVEAGRSSLGGRIGKFLNQNSYVEAARGEASK